MGTNHVSCKNIALNGYSSIDKFSFHGSKLSEIDKLVTQAMLVHAIKN